MTDEIGFDLDFDDLIYMERSTFETFIDPSQAIVLKRLWKFQETYSDMNFYRKQWEDLDD